VAERKAGAARSRSTRTAGKGGARKTSNPLLGDAAREDSAAIRAEHPTCTVAFCPICLVVTAIGDARPDLIEHLLIAGRELLLAARAVIDARLESMDEQEPPTGLQRITIE
jgi:hypothetical protein